MQSITVEKALQLMLEKSNNTATNFLIKALGGFDAVNSSFVALGYSKTKITGFFNIRNERGSFGEKKITSNDVTKAMSDIFNKSSSGAKLTQQYLSNTDPNFAFDYPNQIAHKYGFISKIVGEVAIIKVNQKKYSVATYVPTDITNGNSAAAWQRFRPYVSGIMSDIVNLLKQKA